MATQPQKPSMVSRLLILMWFLKRPRLYRQLLHASRRKVFSWRRDLESSRDLAHSWCARHAVDSHTASEMIIGTQMPRLLPDIFKAVLDAAENRARSCPVRMGGPANLDLLYWIAEALQAEKVIETGVAYGWSSLALLLSLQKRPGSLLISTDMPYPNLNNDKYVGCVVPEDLRPYWQMITLADRQALPKALKRFSSIDMCHYDSDKSYEGRMWAYPLLWKALRPGGAFVSDDIEDNVAFRDFSEALALSPVVVETGEKYVGILIKPRANRSICTELPSELSLIAPSPEQ